MKNCTEQKIKRETWKGRKILDFLTFYSQREHGSWLSTWFLLCPLVLFLVLSGHLSFQLPELTRLFKSMPVAKLAGFLDLTEQEFRIQLLVFKHKMKNLVWTSGISALDGEFQSVSELDFCIDKGMIHIADTKVARRYGEFFIQQMHKFEEDGTEVLRIFIHESRPCFDIIDGKYSCYQEALPKSAIS